MKNIKSKGEYKRIKHTFDPVFDSNSRILILGSLPSVKSREEGFYYGNPRNRFWKVISSIYGYDEPKTVEEKKKMLIESNIAVWDVIDSCDIIGSSDSSIKNVEVTDLGRVLDNCDIEHIFANGKAAGKLYSKFSEQKIGRPIIELPSTSPANAAYTLEKLIEAWKIIK